MSDLWSRAWCETQKIPNFAVKGITPTNEIREAPKHTRSVYSQPTEHDSTCEMSRSPSPDLADSLCFHFRKKKKKVKSHPPPPPTPPPPITRKLRHGTEKIPNFKTPENPPSPHNSVITPPLSPGTVRVRRNLSRTPSTISSGGYQYRLSTCSTSSPPPTPSSAVSSTRTDPHSPRPSKPPSRNCAYTPSPSPKTEDGHTNTYLDKLEEENHKLKNILLLNHINIADETSSRPDDDGTPGTPRNNTRQTLQTHAVTGKKCLPNKAEIPDKNTKCDNCVQLGEELQMNTKRLQLSSHQNVGSENGSVIPNNKIPTKNSSRANSNSIGEQSQKRDPNIEVRCEDIKLFTATDPVTTIPSQMSPAKSAQSKSKSKSVKNAKLPRIQNIVTDNKSTGFLFVDRNGEVLAESIGMLEGVEVIIKRVISGVPGAALVEVSNDEDVGEDRIQAWQKLKQISKTLERTLDGHP